MSINQTTALSPSALAEMLIDNGFDGAAQNSWSQTGIPDTAIADTAKNYSKTVQSVKWKTSVLDLF